MRTLLKLILLELIFQGMSFQDVKQADTGNSTTTTPANVTESTAVEDEDINAVEEESGTSLKMSFCHNELLYSYGVLNSGYLNRRSKLCMDATRESCCSPMSENVALGFWQSNNRVKVKLYAEGYLYTFKAILNYYENFTELAQKVRDFPSSPAVCKTAANDFIGRYLSNDQIKEFMAKLAKAYEQLAFLRKGFYCTLCSVDSQQFFDPAKQTITYANKFCENTVQAFVEEFNERNEVYMRMFNNMVTLLDCDPNKEYLPDAYKLDMQLNVIHKNKVSTCYDAFQKDKDPRVFIASCKDFCGSFSLTKASEIFEGHFGKINFLYKKIRDFGMTPKTIYFNEVEPQQNYDFSKMSVDFFEPNLSNFNLNTFTPVFEKEGLELFYISSQSRFYFNTLTTFEALRTVLTVLIMISVLF